MSKILETIKADYLAARKGSDTVAKNILSPLIGDLNNLAIELQAEVSDVDVIKKVKAYLTGIDTFKLQAPSESERLEKEATVLRKYLPAQLTAEAIEVKIRDCFEAGIKDMKGVQGFFKENFAGLYDGKLVKDLFEKVRVQ